MTQVISFDCVWEKDFGGVVVSVRSQEQPTTLRMRSRILAFESGGAVEEAIDALRPFSMFLPADLKPSDALQAKLQEWCEQARRALARLEEVK